MGCSQLRRSATKDGLSAAMSNRTSQEAFRNCRAHAPARTSLIVALGLLASATLATGLPPSKLSIGAKIANVRAAVGNKLNRESATRYSTEHYRDSGMWFDDATFDFSPRNGRLIRIKLDISGTARCERMISRTVRELGKPLSGDLSAEHSSSTWHRRGQHDYVSVILYDPREGQSTCWKVYAATL